MSENEINDKQQTEGTEETSSNSEVQQQSGEVKFHLDGILGKRLIATFIDFVLVGVLVMILILVGKMLPTVSILSLSALWTTIVFAAGTFLLLAKDGPIDFAGLEGQTPGKKMMEIRVTNLSKKPISFATSMKRNIPIALPYILSTLMSAISIIQIAFLTQIVGLIAAFVGLGIAFITFLVIVFEVYKIYSGERNRRMGDTYAGTIVSWE